MTFIFEFLNLQMERPSLYQGLVESWFQYVSLVVLLFMMFYVYQRSKIGGFQVDRTLKFIAFVMIGFEIYKQVLFTYTNGWTYQWYAFPFQLCSTPMYIGLLAAYSKHPVIKQGSYLFLSTYGFFAGLAVMLYPVSVYTTSVGINIQTMVHHGSMVIMGLIVMFNIKPSKKHFIDGMYVFGIVTIIAIILNEVHALLELPGTFNMFFINPRFSSEIPVLSLFQPIVPGVIYMVIFMIGFSLIALIFLQLHRLIYKKNTLA